MATILIVEDEKKIARFLELELKHEGYDVLTAFDGRSGLETAMNEDPDLLILDLMLPELSGIEVCRRLRHTSDVPIIMLTAKDDVSDKVMGLDMGADDYVTNPGAGSGCPRSKERSVPSGRLYYGGHGFLAGACQRGACGADTQGI